MTDQDTAIKYNRKQQADGKLTEDQVDYLTYRGALVVQQEGAETVDGMAGPKTRALVDQLLDPAPCPTEPDVVELPRGKGMFVRSIIHTGSPEQMIAKMKKAGLTWVCFQVIWQYEDKAKPSRITDIKSLKPYADAVHAEDFQFSLWGYPVPNKEGEYVKAMTEAIDLCGATSVIVDAEAPYYRTKGAGSKLMAMMTEVCLPRRVALGFSSFGAPWFHKTFPWEEFNTADFAVNQSYDADNNLGSDYPRKSQDSYEDLGFTNLIPGSGAWDKTEAQMDALLSNTPTPNGAIIWWDWYNANSSKLWGPVRRYRLS